MNWMKKLDWMPMLCKDTNFELDYGTCLEGQHSLTT